MLKRQAASMKREEFADVVRRLSLESTSTMEERDTLCHLVDILATHTASHPAALVKAGVIEPLIALVASGGDAAQIHAASTLATIAAAKYEYQDRIIAAGGVGPLCVLLKMGSNRANCYAAAAIASLADQPRYQEQILKAGAALPLVRLVREDATVETQLHAADAIADLSAHNPKAQRMFHQAGAVPLLLSLLKGDKAKANTSAAKALARLLSRPLAREPMSSCNASSAEGTSSVVLDATDQGIDDGPANAAVQEEIAREGGVPPLLALLSGMNGMAAVHAAEALALLLSGNAANQATVAKSGGIPPLLAMLNAKSTQAQVQWRAAAAARLPFQVVSSLSLSLSLSPIMRESALPL